MNSHHHLKVLEIDETGRENSFLWLALRLLHVTRLRVWLCLLVLGGEPVLLKVCGDLPLVMPATLKPRRDTTHAPAEFARSTDRA
jgi:hypothetical protein